MRFLFLGSGGFARAVLRHLIDAELRPVLVVTQPPRRRRRGGALEPTPAQALAEEAGIGVFAPENINDPASLERLRAEGADLFAVAEYGQILSQALLDIPRLGAFNVHSSLLPRHRGATPVAAAILAGDRETGVTIQRVVRKLDAGPILAQWGVEIGEREDCGSLTARLADLGGALLVEVLRAIHAGAPPPEHPQAEALATRCRKLSAGDMEVDWSRTAVDVERRIRALNPDPGVRTSLLRDKPLPLRLLRAEVVEGAGAPGEVVAVGREGIDVACGTGVLRILELLPASSRPMTAAAFLNGYRVRPGERFGREAGD